MKTEAAKGLVRIASNYVRLAGTLLLGLTLVPFMLGWVHNEAYGLVALLGAGTGIAAMFQEITDRAVIRELGSAFHAGDDVRFRTIFNSSLVVSGGAAALVFLFFLVLLLCVPVLNIKDPALVHPAQVMVITQGLFATLRTFVSPIFNMQVVTESFISYNFWVLVDRASFLGAALIVRMGMGIEDAPKAIAAWSIGVVLIETVVISVPLALIMAGDWRVRPSPRLASREGVKEVFGTVRWYVAVEVSNNLYERTGALLVNLFLGLSANTLFNIAVQFVSYISQLATGVTQGMEAVSARLGSKSGRSLHALLYHSTRLLGLVAIPAGLVFFVLAPALLRLWVGHKLDEPERDLPIIATSVQIMCLAVVARSIATGWTTVLYGAGFIRSYAPLLLIGAACSPVIAAILLRLAPPSLGNFVVPATITVVYSTVAVLLVPGVVARCLGVRRRELFIPLIRPFVATAACSPVILLAPRALVHFGITLTPVTLVALAGAVGIVYAAISAAVVLDAEERERFLWKPLRRLLSR